MLSYNKTRIINMSDRFRLREFPWLTVIDEVTTGSASADDVKKIGEITAERVFTLDK